MSGSEVLNNLLEGFERRRHTYTAAVCRFALSLGDLEEIPREANFDITFIVVWKLTLTEMEQ